MATTQYTLSDISLQFQPSSANASGDYDLVLGTSFREPPQPNPPNIFPHLFLPTVRNVYLLINFGDFVDGSVNTTADPYVQLLSTTDPASAHADFISVRLDHTTSSAPPTAAPNHAALDAAKAPSPSTSTSSSSALDNVKSAFMREKIPIIVVSAVGVGLVMLGVFVLCCTRNRLSRRGRDSLASTYRSYQHLGAPAPAGDDVPSVRGYHHGPPLAHPNAPWVGR